ncbi:MFS transporter [Limnovirga soli]|uniref:MFS transporter n=1 Tax=Limnovirga soli TaxID=2656915 RepID=A0A8J8FFI9_9BACT|nr:MFS transporter [Limnovirga soli]NNV57120.1 MFS transporter [Limnovirga soli]
MKSTTRVQLSVMMFLQFVVWGAWYGQLSKYLFAIGFDGGQVGNIYATFSIAMIFSPFIAGMIADRFFAAQKVLGVLNIAGAGLLFLLTRITDYNTFYWVMLLYCLTFAPTIALTSSISMRQMVNPEKEFPPIRVLGTVAWIAVTNLVGYMGWGDKSTIFYVSMVTAAVIGLYSFTLPDTPPTVKGPVSFGQVLGKDAFVLFKDRSFAIFFLSSVLICIPLSFYYAMANPALTDAYKDAFVAAHPGQALPNTFFVENKMSLGQASEVFFMLMLPFAYKRFGIKWMLILGLLAWITRFLCFGYGNANAGEWMLFAGILLHGICYDFFFVSGMIYTDLKAGDKIKSQAQGLISLATYGLGMGIGSIISGYVQKMYTTTNGATTVTNWTNVWLVPAGIAAVVLVLFVLFFKDNTRTKTATV